MKKLQLEMLLEQIIDIEKKYPDAEVYYDFATKEIRIAYRLPKDFWGIYF